MDVTIIAFLLVGVAIGALIGWLAVRPRVTRLLAEIDRDRSLHALEKYTELKGISVTYRP